MAKFTVNIKNFIKSLVYDKDEVDTMMNGKADASHEHGDIYYTETEIDTMLNGKADTSDIPTKTSELTNDSGFLTEHQSITGKEDKSNKVTTLSSASTDDQYPSAKLVYDELADKADTADIPTAVSELTNDSGYLVASDVSGKEDSSNKVTSLTASSTDTQYPSAKAVYDGLAGKAASSHSHAISDVTDLQDELDAKADSSDLATVATSGSYADLSNKPTLSDLGGVVTVEKQATADSNYTATYVVKQNGTQVGSKINIPKDYLVKSATLETVGATPSEEESAAGLNTGDKYILFIVNTQESDDPTDLILPVNDLIDTYNADNSTLELNSQNNTFSIKNGGVTRAKLATAVTDELDSKLEASDIDVSFDTTTGILTIEVGETSGE
ncbi:MAG: hypothetical protein IJ104_00490 [Methanobrevibacter sp.]|nr:hypothetical protein [Methanobrevibacter sp.]